MTFKVAVGAGHGGNGSTPGKRTPDNEYEWNFNDRVVDAFIKELKNYEGVSIKRMDDASGKTDVPLRNRTNEANAWGADIYVSFHHNANTGRWGSWTGTETYYSKGSTKGKQLAQLVHKANVKAYGLSDRGLKTSNLHITRETTMPAVLVEGGFMDSTIDIKKMRNNTILANAGKYSAQAVAEYAGLKRKQTNSGANDDLYRVRKSWSNEGSQKGAFSVLGNAKDLADKHGYNVYNSKGAEVYSGKKVAITKHNVPSPVLRYGDKGAKVKQLQTCLNAAYFKCAVDGSFGPETLDALKRFQSVYCNPADGSYGPATARALDKKLNG